MLKNGYEIFILQEPGRGFILSSRTYWIDGCTLSYLARKTIPVLSGYFLYKKLRGHAKVPSVLCESPCKAGFLP